MKAHLKPWQLLEMSEMKVMSGMRLVKVLERCVSFFTLPKILPGHLQVHYASVPPRIFTDGTVAATPLGIGSKARFLRVAR